ncbi:MAG: hypothetical protein ABIF10_03010 [Candidatus Woesearchaeota archaeon]
MYSYSGKRASSSKIVLTGVLLVGLVGSFVYRPLTERITVPINDTKKHFSVKPNFDRYFFTDFERGKKKTSFLYDSDKYLAWAMVPYKVQPEDNMISIVMRHTQLPEKDITGMAFWLAEHYEKKFGRRHIYPGDNILVPTRKGNLDDLASEF